MYKYDYNFTRNKTNDVWDLPNEDATYDLSGESHKLSIAKYINDNINLGCKFTVYCNGVDCAVNSEKELTVQQKSDIDTLVSQYKLIK